MQRILKPALPERERARQDGFEAGLAFDSRCPYLSGTDEAREWESGWLEAVLKRSGVSRKRVRGRSPRRWKKLLRSLVGP